MHVKFTYLYAPQGDVSFDENGTRVSDAAKVFKYFGRNATPNPCRQASGNPVMMTFVCVLLVSFTSSTNTGFQRYLVATDNNSSLIYTGCDNDTTIWPGNNVNRQLN